MLIQFTSPRGSDLQPFGEYAEPSYARGVLRYAFGLLLAVSSCGFDWSVPHDDAGSSGFDVVDSGRIEKDANDGSLGNDGGPTDAALYTVTFQDGVTPSGYSGTRDTTLSEAKPTTNFGTDDNLRADGEDENGGDKDLAFLIRWDLTQIPQGSEIDFVELRFYTRNPSELNNDQYPIYEVKRDWVETEATWNNYAAGKAWGSPGAAASADRGPKVGELVAPSTGAMDPSVLNGEMKSLVQRWVDDPNSNFGLLVGDTSLKSSTYVGSRSSSEGDQRPKLTIRYWH